MHLAHGEMAHQGVNATEKKLQDFYWPKKRSSISRWVRNCTCAPGRLQRRPDGEGKVFDGYRALQAIVVDFLVDTKKNAQESNSERQILVMVDRATGYTRLAETRTRSASDTALAIRDKWVRDFGAPVVEQVYWGLINYDLMLTLC